jgi:uncharacterized alkaline shock family protein YloU
MAVAQPRPMTARTEYEPVVRAGRNELGTISIADQVVSKIAAQAAAENPDAGASAARMLGRAVPGAARVPGVRDTDLQARPKASVEVDGAKAFVALEISVRWPAPVPEVTDQVRSHVRERVMELAGLSADEVDITVADLATDISPPPRAR